MSLITSLSSFDIVFYILAALSLIGGITVIMAQNPIYSALSLAVTMISIAGLFVTLDAFFIAGVQIIVYAGAVMVLFVMVLMLFDLKHEMKTFSKGLIGNGLKLASTGVLLGMLIVYIWFSYSGEPNMHAPTGDVAGTVATTKDLGAALMTNYIFGFEAIGVLLLIIAVGTVTLSRISGGTHAD